VTVVSDLLRDAAAEVTRSGYAETGNLQRRLRIGYARAVNILDQLTEAGICGPADGSHPRTVLMNSAQAADALRRL
jgi:S-DNA-T family DNA segregation ATPase FtsK/SpoIIIE